MRPERDDSSGSARSRRRPATWPGLLVSCLLAALLMVPLLAGLKLLLDLRRNPEDAAVRFTQVSLVDPEELTRLTTLTGQPLPPTPPKPKPEEPPPPDARGQVVDLPSPRDARPPDQPTRYLAKTDARVERETARHGRPGDPDPQARRAPTEPRPRPEPPAPRPGPEEPRPEPSVAALQSLPQPKPDAAATPSEEDIAAQLQPPQLSLPTTESEPLVVPTLRPGRQAKSPRAPTPPPPGAAGGGYAGLLPPLVPSSEPGDRGSDDYLPNLPEGDELALNAREFRYWSYFQRMRTTLKQHWRPAEKYRVRDPWGRIYGVKDRVTVLSVVLDGEGRLQDIQLVEGSGVDFLDDEALRAFRASRQFPNPPAGLVEADGLIRFRFGFAVVHNLQDFNLFRYGF